MTLQRATGHPDRRFRVPGFKKDLDLHQSRVVSYDGVPLSDLGKNPNRMAPIPLIDGFPGGPQSLSGALKSRPTSIAENTVGLGCLPPSHFVGGLIRTAPAGLRTQRADHSKQPGGKPQGTSQPPVSCILRSEPICTH